ncbi:hypothetical protein ES705_38007 [subsurface metagenome]
MEYKIQKFPWFDTISPKNNARECIWKYKRAIEGHKLVLVKVDLIVEQWAGTNDQYFQIYDGHTYSHWGSFPNIFDQATIDIAVLHQYNPSQSIDLSGWECKETTMSWRNTHVENAVRVSAILHYYEVPMTKSETYEYAVTQPRYKYRHGSARTLDRFED